MIPSIPFEYSTFSGIFNFIDSNDDRTVTKLIAMTTGQSPRMNWLEHMNVLLAVLAVAVAVAFCYSLLDRSTMEAWSEFLIDVISGNRGKRFVSKSELISKFEFGFSEPRIISP